MRLTVGTGGVDGFGGPFGAPDDDGGLAGVPGDLGGAGVRLTVGAGGVDDFGSLDDGLGFAGGAGVRLTVGAPDDVGGLAGPPDGLGGDVAGVGLRDSRRFEADGLGAGGVAGSRDTDCAGSAGIGTREVTPGIGSGGLPSGARGPG